MSTQSTKRKYELKERAKAQERTRRRITEAAVELHGTAGPANTSMSAVAELAGVQRATLYRHFPNEEALFDACSAHWRERHPYPDPSPWPEIRDPAERLETALRELYAFYEGAEPMLTRLLRDEALVPTVGARMAAFWGFMGSVREILMEGRNLRGRRRHRVAAAISHAISLATWRSLVREGGLSSDEARGLMLALVAAASD